MLHTEQGDIYWLQFNDRVSKRFNRVIGGSVQGWCSYMASSPDQKMIEMNSPQIYLILLTSLRKHFMALIPIIQTRIKDDPPKLLAAGWVLAASISWCPILNLPSGCTNAIHNFFYDPLQSKLYWVLWALGDLLCSLCTSGNIYLWADVTTSRLTVNSEQIISNLSNTRT